MTTHKMPVRIEEDHQQQLLFIQQAYDIETLRQYAINLASELKVVRANLQDWRDGRLKSAKYVRVEDLFTPGQEIRHFRFGAGIVKEISDGEVVVNFIVGGQRRLHILTWLMGEENFAQTSTD